MYITLSLPIRQFDKKQEKLCIPENATSMYDNLRIYYCKIANNKKISSYVRAQ